MRKTDNRPRNRDARRNHAENEKRHLSSIWNSLRNREAAIGSANLKAQVTLPRLKFLEKEMQE